MGNLQNHAVLASIINSRASIFNLNAETYIKFFDLNDPSSGFCLTNASTAHLTDN